MLRRGDTVHLVEILRLHGVLFGAVPIGGKTALTFILRGDSATNVATAVQGALAAANLNGAAVTVRPFDLPRVGLAEDLKPIERQTLDVALALGYYETPRRCTLDEIGRELGITKSAVHHRLSGVENRALRSIGDLTYRPDEE